METITRLYKVNFEERAKGDSTDEKEFVGTPIVFNSLSEDLGGFKEIISRNAWESADFTECFAVFNHNERDLLGTFAAGTLRFTSVDDTGVHVAIDKAETTISRDCSEWVRRKEVTGMSFKFTVAEDGMEYNLDDDDNIIRTITKFDKIYDVSLVTRPAYRAAEVRSKMDDEVLAEIRSRLTIPEQEIEEEETVDDTSTYDYYSQLHIHHKHKL
jgi:HK97 family phage prohead protease